jgi:hypothetical protein
MDTTATSQSLNTSENLTDSSKDETITEIDLNDSTTTTSTNAVQDDIYAEKKKF